jgi:hypothetical protein
MKTKLLLFGLLTLALAAGCTQLDRAYRREVAVVKPATVTTNQVLVTNLVVTAGGTNLVVTPVLTVTTHPPVLVTNLVEIPAVRGGIEVVSGVAGGAGIPFAGAGALLLGWAYSAYAAFRNRRLATALVTGIEAGRKILQETPEGQKLDGRVKDALIEHQEIASVLHAASRLVNTYTANTVK